jgi:DNA-binding CsgD family transcriptional regulator
MRTNGLSLVSGLSPRQTLCAVVAEGAPLSSIADEHGVSRQAVYKQLRGH